MMVLPFIPHKDRVIQLTKKSKSNMLGAGAKIYEAIQNNHNSSKKNFYLILNVLFQQDLL
jgi:hypothetical protein